MKKGLLSILMSTMLMIGVTVDLKSQTVVDIVVNSAAHDTLEAAVIAAGLADDLSGAGPFTVFAPTDDVFKALPAGTIETLLLDPTGLLADILLYHVVGAKAMSTDLSDGQEITTLLGKKLTVTINGEGVFINNAKVTVADIEGTNGVVHVIDAVLMPPVITVVDVVVNSPMHDTLEAAVIAAGLADDLAGEGPFTIFAPTDEAFKALPAGTIETLLEDPTGDLADILLYHVVGTKAMSTDLSDGQVIATLLGKDITVTINGEGVFINNARVTLADIEVDNGVVHVIDAVLLPPALTVVDIVVNSTTHDTLEAAVIAAGLADDLSGAGPFTVFAPTDDAFKALPAGTIETLLEDPTGDLADILLYHVVGAKAMSTDLSNGQVIATLLAGKNITVTINNDGVFINDTKVTIANIEADNGVVHVIDAVLLPPTETGIFQGAKAAKVVSVFPNPAVNQISIAGIDDANKGYLKIIDINGATVYNAYISNFKERINLGNINSGVYFLQVETAKGRYAQKLLVK